MGCRKNTGTKAATQNFSYDWNIRRNPAYKMEKWTERNPIGFEVIKGLITAIFSIIVSVILTLKIIDNKKDNKQNDDESSKALPLTKKNVSDTVTIDSSKVQDR